MARILNPSHWHLYVIVDPEHLTPGLTAREVTQEALRGGARTIQLRDKRSSLRDRIVSARALQALCDAHGAMFIVNDRVDVALAAGADGVHLGPEDMPVVDARRIAPSLVIGASTGSAEGAVALISEGADYLGVGALYEASPSKSDASAPRGLDVVREVREALGEAIPFVGIGGIDVTRAREVVQAGAHGVAVIRAVAQHQDPRAAAAEILSRIRA